MSQSTELAPDQLTTIEQRDELLATLERLRTTLAVGELLAYYHGQATSAAVRRFIEAAS